MQPWLFLLDNFLFAIRLSKPRKKLLGTPARGTWLASKDGRDGWGSPETREWFRPVVVFVYCFVYYYPSLGLLSSSDANHTSCNHFPYVGSPPSTPGAPFCSLRRGLLHGIIGRKVRMMRPVPATNTTTSLTQEVSLSIHQPPETKIKIVDNSSGIKGPSLPRQNTRPQ